MPCSPTGGHRAYGIFPAGRCYWNTFRCTYCSQPRLYPTSGGVQIEATRCVWEAGGTLASGLDVASAGPATFSAGCHSSDLSAPSGRVFTTRPLHGTGFARLGRVVLLGITPMQAGPICLVADLSLDQRPDADIPACLGLPIFIFRTFVAHSNLPYPIWIQVTRRLTGRLHILCLLEQIECQEFSGASPLTNHGRCGE